MSRNTSKFLAAAALTVLCAGLVAVPSAEAVAPDCTTSTITTVGTSSCVVPLGIETITVNIWGARGGASGNGPGAFGALITTTLHVVPGETLSINVGGIGGNASAAGAAGGFNGGGAGGTFAAGAGGGTGAGGGGASDIRIGGVTDDKRIIVAGGGGGQGYGSAGGTGGQVGADGAGGSSQGGLGATQSAAGAGGASGGSAGVGSAGGAGAPSTEACCSYFYGGAGGGGGWFGGGGGGAASGGSFSAGAGGGGSSNAVSTGGRTTGTTYYSGADALNSGNGKVDMTLATTTSYTVTYLGNGNDTGTVPVDGNSPYLSGTDVTVLGNTGNLTKNGYQFRGWQVSPTPPSGNAYPSVGGTFTLTANSTLTARWGGGPLEFRASPGGAAVSSIAFPPTANGSTSSLTVYVRNVGNVAVDVSNITPNGSGVSRTSGTCSAGGGAIQPYNNGSVADCTYIFGWTASGALSYPFSVNYFTSNTVTLTGTPLNPARTPTFDTPVRTVTGYTVNVTNYDALWNWAASVTTGTGVVTPGSATATTLPLTVTGVSPGASVTITVDTTRSGYVAGTATRSGTALNAALTPTFDTPVRTATGYTVNVTNYDALWNWTPSVNHGVVTAGTASGGVLPLTVTGLAANSSADVTVAATRSTYADGSGSVSGTSLPITLDPPSNVKVVEGSKPGTLEVSFDAPANAANDQTYTVKVYSDASMTTLVASVPGVPKGTLVTGLVAGVTYWVAVVADGSTGYVASAASASSSGEAKPDPGPNPSPNEQSVATKYQLPAKVASGGTTVLVKANAKTQQGQPITGRARCVPFSRALVPFGDVRAQCRVWTSKSGALKVWTSGRVPVSVHAVQVADGTATLDAYRVAKTYRVGAAAR